jgi:ankyrin repeat protein
MQDMHTALHYASQCSDGTELVPRLLALGANPNALNHLGSSPLHFACLSGSLEVVEALLEAEAQLEVRDDDGTPFDVAAQEGRIEIMRALAARGADVNTIGVDGENVLFDAVRRTDMEVVRECIRLGVNACAKDGSGCTLLHILAFEQHRSENEARSSSTESEIRRELVRLLAESGAGVNERDCELRTPMHVAVEQQNSAAALALLYAGSDLQLTNQVGLSTMYRTI